MVVLVLQNVELEIRGVEDVDLIVEEEESFRVDGPTWGWGVELGRCDQVRVEFLNVHNDHGMQGGDREECCMEGQCQLLLCEYGVEVVWVYAGIVASSLFRIDVPSSCQCIGLGTYHAFNG